jgi:hypothetical protein
MLLEKLTFVVHTFITKSVTDETAREVNGAERVVAVSLVTSKAPVIPTKN